MVVSTPRHSPPPLTAKSTPSASVSTHDVELRTPNTTRDADEEFEPSSLSLADRLAFFSSLCEGGGGGGGSGSSAGRLRSRTSSYTRSPPYSSIERCSSVNSYNSHNSCNGIGGAIPTTPRSSTTTSSASVTPTPMPMECSPILHEVCEQSESTLETATPLQSEAGVCVSPSASMQTLSNGGGYHELKRSATAPIGNHMDIGQPAAPEKAAVDGVGAPTVRRIRLRTVGKLVLPQTFLSDRNNNVNNQSCAARLQTLEDLQVTLGSRKIGKIKSPFIEQQQHHHQQQQQHSTPTELCSKSPKFDYKSTPHSYGVSSASKMHSSASDSSDDTNASDSGKENCAANQQQHQQQQPPESTNGGGGGVLEMRRKLTRLVNGVGGGSGGGGGGGGSGQQQTKSVPIQRRHTTEISNSSLTSAANTNNNNRRPNSFVDQRFAKYFGLKETFETTTTCVPLAKTQSAPPQPQSLPSEARNAHVRLPANGETNNLVQKRRELLKRTRTMTLEISGLSAGPCPSSPTSMPSAKRAHSPAAKTTMRKTLISCFEDIVITQEDLHKVGHEFRQLDVTPKELYTAGQDFKRLFGEILQETVA
ncbi:uncharacterized protein LOC115632871 isoform X8 [Scaptodrosophila lebanonensis]|uniref:Uncharacterized protein LOC115632871 isoform X8 n=1 Tax=Drosophila lebanonensis TaxID=7225 RepID=A0A6J2UCZ8_DROLE|nr:uncharacterized protein LOC115632871 isoform X8 [Scaptodrosophila lebanonensis]